MAGWVLGVERGDTCPFHARRRRFDFRPADLYCTPARRHPGRRCRLAPADQHSDPGRSFGRHVQRRDDHRRRAVHRGRRGARHGRSRMDRQPSVRPAQNPDHGRRPHDAAHDGPQRIHEQHAARGDAYSRRQRLVAHAADARLQIHDPAELCGHSGRNVYVDRHQHQSGCPGARHQGAHCRAWNMGWECSTSPRSACRPPAWIGIHRRCRAAGCCPIENRP